MHEDIQKRYLKIRRILLLILALNWGVAILKIVYGLSSRCTSMTADGFHSLSDGTSNIIGLIGITLASHPKDADHPYGHKKYETFFSLGIATLLCFISLNLIREGINRIFNPVLPQIDLVSFAIMAVTLGINFWVMRYEYKKGESLRSDILISDSMHTKADIFTSLSVLVTLVAIKLGYPIMDPIITLIIALFIAYAALGIARQSAKILCDSAIIVDVKKIENIVLGIKGVKACHKIRTRGRPDDINVDLHVQVIPSMHISQAHEISYRIEGALKENIPEISDVVVHMEPQEKENPA